MPLLETNHLALVECANGKQIITSSAAHQGDLFYFFYERNRRYEECKKKKKKNIHTKDVMRAL